jgi:hypothetical protein
MPSEQLNYLDLRQFVLETVGSFGESIVEISIQFASAQGLGLLFSFPWGLLLCCFGRMSSRPRESVASLNHGGSKDPACPDSREPISRDRCHGVTDEFLRLRWRAIRPKLHPYVPHTPSVPSRNARPVISVSGVSPSLETNRKGHTRRLINSCFSKSSPTLQSPRLAKRRRALVETNPPRNSQSETHQDDVSGSRLRAASF